MFEGIKNACIFFMIAQVLMIMVPGEAYAKYVKALILSILILKITQPIWELLSGNEAAGVIEANMEQLQRSFNYSEKEELLQEGMQLYEDVEKSICSQLEEAGMQKGE